MSRVSEGQLWLLNDRIKAEIDYVEGETIGLKDTETGHLWHVSRRLFYNAIELEFARIIREN